MDRFCGGNWGRLALFGRAETGRRGVFVLRRRVLPEKRGVGRFFGEVASNFFVVFVFGLSHSATMQCLIKA